MPPPADPEGAAASPGTVPYADLVTPLLPRALGYARSLLRDSPEAAEDAVQQAALRGLERLAAYDRRRPFAGWFFTLVHHACMDLHRARRPAAPLPADPPAAPEAAVGSDEEAADARRAALARAFAQLSPVHADILRLRYFGDLSYADLSEALGIPQGTVMSRLHAARHALASLLQEPPP